jgi:hypothetical protein
MSQRGFHGTRNDINIYFSYFLFFSTTLQFNMNTILLYKDERASVVGENGSPEPMDRGSERICCGDNCGL